MIIDIKILCNDNNSINGYKVDVRQPLCDLRSTLQAYSSCYGISSGFVIDFCYLIL